MEPIDWLVDKILPVGLSILGAPSKYYKSYMALGLCVAICQGAKFLGFDCTKHDCLYFDLEKNRGLPETVTPLYILNARAGAFGKDTPT